MEQPEDTPARVAGDSACEPEKTGNGAAGGDASQLDWKPEGTQDDGQDEEASSGVPEDLEQGVPSAKPAGRRRGRPPGSKNGWGKRSKTQGSQKKEGAAADFSVRSLPLRGDHSGRQVRSHTYSGGRLHEMWHMLHDVEIMQLKVSADGIYSVIRNSFCL